MSERPQKGFTLIEVMIALAILSGVVVTVLTSLNYHLKAASTGTDDVTATLLGKNKLEELLLEREVGDSSGSFDEHFEEYTWSLKSEDTELENLKKLTLSVKRDEKREIRLVTYAIAG